MDVTYILESYEDSSIQYILDEKKAPYTVGRSVDALINILSRSVSRQHAVICTNTDQRWIIKDMSSNGSYVNGKQLVRGKPRILYEGDVIQFGDVRTTPDGKNLRYFVRCNREDDDSRGCNREDNDSRGCNREDDDSRCQNGKRSLVKSPSSSQHITSPNNKMQRLMTEYEMEQDEKTKLSQEKMKKELEEKERVLRELQERLAEKDSEKEELKKHLESEKERMMKEQEEMIRRQDEEREALIIKMEEEKEEMRVRLEKELGQQLESKEQELRGQLEMSRMSFVNEREKVVVKLEDVQREMVVKDAERTEELRREKDRLDGIIAQMELKQKMLESELVTCKHDVDKEKGQVLKAKEDILQCFTDLAESELQCCICQELFIKATTLNCSHSYCHFCITQWKDDQHKTDCPICRQPIVSINRALVLDSYISKLIEHMTDDLKEHRKKIVQERNDLEAAVKAALTPPTTAPQPSTSGRGRGQQRGGRVRRGRRGNGPSGRGGGPSGRGGEPSGRGVGPSGRGGEPSGRGGEPSGRGVRSRGGGRGRSRGEVNDSVQLVEEVPVVDIEGVATLSSSNDDTDSMRSFISSDSQYDSSSSEEGYPGAYYGGYGSCFICGRRGHWATGCPNR